VAAGIGTDDRPLPVGGARRVELPAGDAAYLREVSRRVDKIFAGE